jgi:hypothetical protein
MDLGSENKLKYILNDIATTSKGNMNPSGSSEIMGNRIE